MKNLTYPSYQFYEFFAGGGMARAGLSLGWNCLFANDFDAKKAESYRANWGNRHLVVSDIARVSTEQLKGRADLAWASFPCQDLSLAGNYRGLEGDRSRVFWSFWSLMVELRGVGRAPHMIALENVYGLLTSNGGEDFRTLVSALSKAGYRAGAMVIDAKHFVPQSRPRLFVLAVDESIEIPRTLIDDPTQPWHPDALYHAHDGLSDQVKKNWVWWNVPQPPKRTTKLVDVMEREPIDVRWHTNEETAHLLGMMTKAHREKVNLAEQDSLRIKGPIVGSLYRRMRNGVQRAEVRFDDIAGCLRTPRGGSSRLTLAIIENGTTRTRLLGPREAARLMGLPESYVLPKSYNQAYHLCGDGVAVPIVRMLATQFFEQIAATYRAAAGAA
jgi:DNA (cytosine-5)-methyltransferase 1